MLLSKSDGGGPAHEQAGSPGYLSRPDPGRHSSARAGVQTAGKAVRGAAVTGIDEQGSTQNKQMAEFKARPLQPSTTGVAPAVPPADK
jgi:hypothetical protein